MKLVRHGLPGAERPGLIDEAGAVRDLSGVIEDIGPATLGPEVLARLAAMDPASLPLVVAGRLGPPVANPGKILCIGLNYSDHAAEAGMPIPEHPILFLKATSALCGPTDPLILPRGSTATDWEVELAVIIGTRCKYVSEAEALTHVAGYATFNDVSERDFQLTLTGQWTKGKSCDSFAPLGPWLVTADAVPDPQDLALTLDVNGERMQTGRTDKMIFSVAQIIAHLSTLMTLHPSDIIATGTPPGVGMGMDPKRYLSEGDVVEAGIAGLGTQRQVVIADD
ncbi:MAG: fumarylacetoacetate hydrolase family protein [Pseudomonadota bacterium]